MKIIYVDFGIDFADTLPKLGQLILASFTQIVYVKLEDRGFMSHALKLLDGSDRMATRKNYKFSATVGICRTSKPRNVTLGGLVLMLT